MTAPALRGVPIVGRTLRLRPGAVSPAPATISVRWYRGKIRVRKARGYRYPLTARDHGYRIRALVVFRNDAGGYRPLGVWTIRTARVR